MCVCIYIYIYIYILYIYIYIIIRVSERVEIVIKYIMELRRQINKICTILCSAFNIVYLCILAVLKIAFSKLSRNFFAYCIMALSTRPRMWYN